MPVESVWVGTPFTMLQNVVYALPDRKATMFSDTTTPTLQQSTTAAFTNNQALTLATGNATVAGGFIRSTAGVCVACFKYD